MDLLISQRAKRIYELSSQLLLEDETDDVQGEAYRFSYLVLRGPKSFKKAFEHGRLDLEAEKIRDAFWAWRFDLQGPKGLTQEEMDLIDFHNEQVEGLQGNVYELKKY